MLPETPLDYRKLLVEHLGVIEKISRIAARRHGLSVADAEEFGAIVRFKLVDRDFAILRKFEGRSQLNTYLTVVIDRLCKDFCVARWGRWRPSASARRLGPVATLLEQLIVREGATFDEAVGTLQTNHQISKTREELHDLLLQLPPRFRFDRDDYDPSDHDALSNLPGPHPEDEQLVQRVEDALARAITTLSEQDRHILILRFDAELPVAQVARSLGLGASTLHRRLGQILNALRTEMNRREVDEADIARVIAHPRLSMSSVLVGTPGSNDV